MDAKTKITIDLLTQESVSVRTQTFIDFQGEEKEVDNRRKAYVNSENGRTELQAEQPQNIVDAVLAIWGDSPAPEYTESGKG